MRLTFECQEGISPSIDLGIPASLSIQIIKLLQDFLVSALFLISHCNHILSTTIDYAEFGRFEGRTEAEGLSDHHSDQFICMILSYPTHRRAPSFPRRSFWCIQAIAQSSRTYSFISEQANLVMTAALLDRAWWALLGERDPCGNGSSRRRAFLRSSQGKCPFASLLRKFLYLPFPS